MLNELPTSMLLYSELNLLSIVSMGIIAVSAMRSSGSGTRRTRLFVLSVALAALANVFDFFWNIGITEFWVIPFKARSLLNFCYFVSFGTSCYCWYLYTQAAFSGELPSPKHCLLIAIPLMLLALLLLISSFTGIVFYFDEQGVYHRGPLFYLQHVLSYGYIVAASIVCYVRAGNKENYDRRGDLMNMAGFIVPPLVCIIVQIFLQDLPVLSVGIMISFLLATIHSLEGKISRDGLTQIASRREMLRLLSNELRGLHRDEPLFFFFMDIDGFKHTNDRHGHAEGDRALQTLGKTLRYICDESGGWCARYGGDEFAYFVRCGSESEAELLRQLIEDLAEKRGREAGLKDSLRLSIGVVRHSPGQSIPELISEADDVMYRVKQQKKAARTG